MTDTVVVVFDKDGAHFEVLCKKNTVLDYRAGKIGVDKCLITDDIFTNAGKGDRAAVAALEAAFGTTDSREIAIQILKEGRYSMTAAERKRLCDERLDEMMNMICGSYIDAQTGHILDRASLQAALDRIKGFKTDPDQSAERQLPALLKRLEGILLLQRAEPVLMRVGIQNEYVGKFQSQLARFGTPQNEIWTNSGLVVDIQIAKRDMDDFYAFINQVTNGVGRVAVLEGSGMRATDDVSTAGRKDYKHKAGHKKGTHAR